MMRKIRVSFDIIVDKDYKLHNVIEDLLFLNRVRPHFEDDYVRNLMVVLESVGEEV